MSGLARWSCVLARQDFAACCDLYDGDGRCNAVTDYDGNATSLQWDSSGSRVSVTDAESQRFTTSYNGDGLRVLQGRKGFSRQCSVNCILAID